ncbi:alcohol oxidase [Mycena latifolia]|nr:alcohol oxidase [Mycena latifolia]
MKFAVELSAAALLLSLTTATVAWEATAEHFANQQFDFIVVGGGTAGLVVAARLTEDPKITVGIIEAGQYRPNDPLIEIPQSIAAPSNPNSTALIGNPTYDWGLLSTPQPGLNGKSIPLPRQVGKVVGGSSAINFMVWQRGAQKEYDLWSTKAETWVAPPASPVLLPGNTSSRLAKAHGANGPLAISYNNFLTTVDQPLVRAGIELGLKANFNPDLGDPIGFSSTARSVDYAKGIRTYATNSYYTPNAHRKNLVLLTGAQVTKVVFDTKTGIIAKAVEYTANSKTYTVHVIKEVILSAGTLKTPQILELSGVGDKVLLAKHDIPLVLDLPGVGENLKDHPFSGADFKLKPGAITLDNLCFNSSFKIEEQELYNSSRRGILSYTIPIAAPLTLQSLIGHDETNQLLRSLTQSLNNISQSPLQKVQSQAQIDLLKGGDVPFLNMIVYPVGGLISSPAAHTSYVTMVAVEVHPFSRGSVHINSSDPLVRPTIDPHFLEIPFDAQILVKAQQFTQRWMLSKALRGQVESLNEPSSAVKSDAEWESFVRTHTQPLNHPVGTTAMAPRSMGGVVDSQLKVHGLENVRVVDASIMPSTISVPIQQTVYAIAEQGADMIKKSWNISNKLAVSLSLYQQPGAE